MATVTRSNPKAFETLNAHLKALEGKQVKIGWFETAKYEDGTPIAYVAAIQEMGCPAKSIPPRPFMRPSIARDQNNWMRVARKAAKGVLEGNSSVDDAMTTIGAVIVGSIETTIAGVYSPPLSEITLMARKYRQQGKTVTGKTIGEIAALIAAGKADYSGVSTKPLVDKGDMVATLIYVVEDAK